MDNTWSKALEHTKQSIDRKADLIQFAKWENVLNAFGNFLAAKHKLASLEDRNAIFGRIATRHHMIPDSLPSIKDEHLLMLLCDDWHCFIESSNHDDATKAAIAELCPLKTTPLTF